MFELTTSNLDHDLREQKIADGLRRRQLLDGTGTEPDPRTGTTLANAVRRPAASAGRVGHRAAAQR